MSFFPQTEFDDASLDEWFATLTDYRNRIRDELSREVPLGDFRAYDDPAIQWAKSETFPSSFRRAHPVPCRHVMTRLRVVPVMSPEDGSEC